MQPWTGERPAHLPTPPPHPPGYWQRQIVEFPDPLTPFWSAWLLPVHNAALRSALVDLGLLVERIEYREIEGYVYRRVVAFGLQRMPPLLLRPIFRALVRVRPASRSRLNVAIRAAHSRAWRETIMRWRHEWSPQLDAQRDSLALEPVLDSDASTLDQFAEQALRASQEALRARARVLVAAAIELGFTAVAETGSESGVPPAESVRKHLATHDPIAGEPITADRPELPGSFAGADGTAEPVQHEAASLVESTELAFRPACARRLAERLGRLLQARELLDAEGDIYFVTLDEARAALRAGGSLSEVATRRRGAWQQARLRRPPESYGDPPPPQPLSMYPAAAAETTSALLRGLGLFWASASA